MTSKNFSMSVAGGVAAVMACVGSPDDCYEYVATLDRWGVDTFFGMFQMGAMPFDMTMRSIELFGKEVLPRFVAS